MSASVWKKCKLSQFATIYSGTDYKHNKKGELFPIIGTGGVMGFTGEYLNEGPAVLTGRKGTIDKPLYVEGKFWNVDTIFCIKPFDDTDIKLFYYAISNKNLSTLNEATGVPSVSSDNLYKLAFTFPTDINEQKRIASILSTCDTMIQKTQSTIEKYKAIKQGMMQDLFTRGLTKDGKLRPSFKEAPEHYKECELGLIPKEWEVKSFSDIGRLSMCKRVFQYETKSEGEIPFYKIGTFGGIPDAYISKKLYENYKNSFAYPKKGDILISASGTIGRTVIFDGQPAYFQDSNIVWLEHNESKIINQYLFYLYKTITWNLEGSTIKRLYNDNFNNIIIAFPSDLSEQTAIASRLSSIDTTIQKEEALLAKYKKIKNGLMNDLLVPPKGATIIDETGDAE